MEARQADAAGYFPTFFVGTFIKALRRAHPGLCGKYLGFPCRFVGTFPNPTLLRSWAHHSTGTELFCYETRPKHQQQASPTSYYPPPPHIPAEKPNTPE